MSEPEKEESNRPHDTAFRQQRLPAWQPILTAGNVMPTFFLIGIAFIPIGIAMYTFSASVKEEVFDYTKCGNCDEKVKYANDVCECGDISFTIDESWEGPVYMYYGLTNFYQNHRRYVKSRDDSQLIGDVNKDPSSDCQPFDVDENGRKYVPCGAIANSLFTDVIHLYKVEENGDHTKVPLISTGIAWESDRDYKFKNPEGDLKQALVQANAVKPRDWPFELWELGLNDTEGDNNIGLENEDLIVWMKAAALPNFRKLYRKIENGLTPGTYTFKILYRFRVVQFSGTKSVILSTMSLLGGKNPFLGIAYTVVGGLYLVMGVVFLIIHIKFGKQSTDILHIAPGARYD